MAGQRDPASASEGGGPYKSEFDVELDWLKYQPEDNNPGMKKFIELFKANPFVPLGAGVTIGALVVGLRALSQKNQAKQQAMMRLRVIAQGFTVVALVGGFFIQATQNSK